MRYCLKSTVGRVGGRLKTVKAWQWLIFLAAQRLYFKLEMGRDKKDYSCCNSLQQLNRHECKQLEGTHRTQHSGDRHPEADEQWRGAQATNYETHMKTHDTRNTKSTRGGGWGRGGGRERLFKRRDHPLLRGNQTRFRRKKGHFRQRRGGEEVVQSEDHSWTDEILCSPRSGVVSDAERQSFN